MVISDGGPVEAQALFGVKATENSNTSVGRSCKPSTPQGRFAKPSYVGSELRNKAAGEVLTAKQAPHRPGTAPALGLRAGRVTVAIIPQTACFKEQLL
jgi:hypothetical protein